MPVEISLTGQVGLVTGAGTPYGIGRSLVLQLAKAGAKAIYACDLNTAHFDALKSTVKDTGNDCIVEGCCLDVVSEEQTVALLKRIVKTHGRFDFFFANAGFSNYRYLAIMTILEVSELTTIQEPERHRDETLGQRDSRHDELGVLRHKIWQPGHDGHLKEQT
jgi:NAD(P)-dependent dehydrogenase (short-subunit alcohol dehydrogenase family)